MHREKPFFPHETFCMRAKEDFCWSTYDPDDTLRCTCRTHVEREVVSLTDSFVLCRIEYRVQSEFRFFYFRF